MESRQDILTGSRPDPTQTCSRAGEGSSLPLRWTVVFSSGQTPLMQSADGSVKTDYFVCEQLSHYRYKNRGVRKTSWIHEKLKDFYKWLQHTTMACSLSKNFEFR